jgi:hypothetical protein
LRHQNLALIYKPLKGAGAHAMHTWKGSRRCVPLSPEPHLIARHPGSKTGKKAIVLNAPAMKLLVDLPRLGSFVIAGKSTGTEHEAPRSDLNRPWRAVAKRAGLVGVRIP